MSKKKLILLELNEINFDVVQRYLDTRTDAFPALRRLMASRRIRTTSENRYELLEPWIQWPSVHTGMSFEEHGVFRLGDMALADKPQFFEELERRGWRVGAVSPMNAANRLRESVYFIPDPWTSTPTDGSWWSRALGAAISQAVNDNAQAHIQPRSILHLLLGLTRFAQPKNYLEYFRLAIRSRGAPWRRALFLDLFLHDLHLGLFLARDANFSVLFMNAGAHIQHHYFLNAEPLREEIAARNPEWYATSDSDPVAEMLAVYDRVIADYQSLKGVEVIVATGLSQSPYDRVKYYYRLKDHSAFLGLIGVKPSVVLPRMTRDFLVKFSDVNSAVQAEQRLAAVFAGAERVRLFGEIDNRGTSLFVTLTYPDEIGPGTEFHMDGLSRKLAPHVAFVAIKNGMHQEGGFAFFSDGLARLAPEEGAHVKELHVSVMEFFGDPAKV